jgi:hypothetical protein
MPESTAGRPHRGVQAPELPESTAGRPHRGDQADELPDSTAWQPVDIREEAPLYLGEVDTGQDPPTLVASIAPCGDVFDREESRLVPDGEGGFSLEDDLWLVGMAEDSSADVVPEDFVLTFDLTAPWADPGTWPTITEQGGQTRAVLWNDWPLRLTWGAAENWCK